MTGIKLLQDERIKDVEDFEGRFMITNLLSTLLGQG